MFARAFVVRRDGQLVVFAQHDADFERVDRVETDAVGVEKSGASSSMSAGVRSSRSSASIRSRLISSFKESIIEQMLGNVGFDALVTLRAASAGGVVARGELRRRRAARARSRACGTRARGTSYQRICLVNAGGSQSISTGTIGAPALQRHVRETARKRVQPVRRGTARAFGKNDHRVAARELPRARFDELGGVRIAHVFRRAHDAPETRVAPVRVSSRRNMRAA